MKSTNERYRDADYEPCIDNEKMQQVLDYIKNSGGAGATHGGLHHRFFGDQVGQRLIVMEDNNVELCHGMPDGLADIIEELWLHKKLIHVHATHILVYFADGCRMPMKTKMMTRRSREKSKKPRWLPVVFYPGAQCDMGSVVYNECPWTKTRKVRLI